MLTVSTHSRPKAAAFNVLSGCFSNRRFNTQPPEGGCKSASTLAFAIVGFNTQPPEGGCAPVARERTATTAVSTHSHPKVAASCHRMNPLSYVFQHTATRRWLQLLSDLPRKRQRVSTHSHPKVAAGTIIQFASNALFQHTATRRWLHL